MKVFLFIAIIVSRIFAIDICGQDIRLGDKMGSINEKFYEVVVDSTGVYAKILYISLIPANKEFSSAVIEVSVISGTICNIKLYNEAVIGTTVNGQNIDSIKSCYNNYVKKLAKTYDKCDKSTDSLLFYENFKDVKINSIISFSNDSEKVYCSIQEVGMFLTCRVMYFIKDFDDNMRNESELYDLMKEIERIEEKVAKNSI